MFNSIKTFSIKLSGLVVVVFMLWLAQSNDVLWVFVDLPTKLYWVLNESTADGYWSASKNTTCHVLYAI